MEKRERSAMTRNMGGNDNLTVVARAVNIPMFETRGTKNTNERRENITASKKSSFSIGERGCRGSKKHSVDLEVVVAAEISGPSDR